MEFIVGKWYKNPGKHEGAIDTFAKFEKWEDNWFHFTEWIINEVYENKISKWSYSKTNKVYEPVNIEEIQQYLPANHPDLLIVNEDYNYLIPILERYGIK
jgi:hypothetical protein